MSVLDNFDQWKSFLNERVQQALDAGMSQETIVKVADQIGDYLAKNVDPKTGEERLLAELWKVATPEEQRALASMMVKYVKQ